MSAPTAVSEPQDQANAFHRDGFLIANSLFLPQEMKPFKQEIVRLFKETGDATKEARLLPACDGEGVFPGLSSRGPKLFELRSPPGSRIFWNASTPGTLRL